MSQPSWFDNRTLFVCQCMLVIMFAVVFMWMNRVYPHVRGLRSTMGGFLLGIPCTFLLVERGHISSFLSIVVANTLAVTAFAMLYDGVMRFIGGRRHIWLLAAVSVITMGVVFYYSQVRQEIVPRIVATSLVAALFRGLTGYELIRRSRISPNRSTMRFFGGFLVILAFLGVSRAVSTAIQGAPENFMERNPIQTSTIMVGLLYIGVSGLCFLIMASHELVMRSKEASEQDLLSETLNRRGIEARLTVELKRCNRTPQSLCVALVDIDHFKKINDNYGHAAGDKAIRDVAEAMSRRLRGVDYLGRYGGDEFLIVLPQTACGNALIVAERLRAAVTGLTVGGGNEQLTLSIGITEASPGDDALTLISRADEALYKAKSSGRNCMRMVLPQITFPDMPPARAARVTAQL